MIKYIILSFSILQVLSKTKDEWKSRTVYQLLTDRFATSTGKSSSCNLSKYCGGDYKGIINNLDYITNMGFDAIWISPVNDNYDDGYHGYWYRNMYDVNKNFGNAQDLKNLVTACHNKGVWVMVDVVANHMGNTNQDYTKNYPFNQSAHYHDYCIISDNDFNTHNLANIQKCRLAGLADLNQDNSFVQSELINWIKWLITEYQFDGIRIDTVMMVKTDFWTKFTNAAGVYSVGEVFDGDMGFLKQFIGPINGLLNYPLFYTLRDVLLHNKGMNTLETFFNNIASSFGKANLPYMGNFNDNHDNARFLNDAVTGYIPQDFEFFGENSNFTVTALKKLQFKAITAFTLTSVGIPMIYYGTEQYYAGGNDPNNREVLWNHLDQTSEMYKFIKTINEARKTTKAASQDQIQRYADADIYAFTRGTLFAAFSNKYDKQVVKSITYHPYAEGTTLCNIFYTTDCVKVASGAFPLYLNYGEVKIFIPK
ncbi:unnamed protein product [Paramecium octaurelia]|uniref:alpha-amylase n=1 Tax=Paramecium octaurelia TaxID=43137 RepID=A0A8S1WI04_PAROT|nr:unnamed protein product [Paramecium octaurelia]